MKDEALYRKESLMIDKERFVLVLLYLERR